MFQARFLKVDEFGCWDMYSIQTHADMHFTSKEFQEVLYIRVVQLELATPDLQ